MHARASLPLVTLGMPVRNEAKFLRASLDNLLAQTYRPLEIIIADNGSTDATPEICAEYTAKHPHITFIRHPKNLGQPANFNYLPRLASGTYFAWASGHDLLDPAFVEKSVTLLESDPAIVLAYPRTINITEDGTPTREKVRPFDLTGMSPAQRFREVMWRVDCNYVYGMWRLAPMLESRLFQAIPAADRVFLAEMAIKGTFAPVDTVKYYRANRGMTAQTEMEKRHRLMAYLFPHRTFTDKELAGNTLYLPTIRGFRRAVEDARFPWFTRPSLACSVWLCGVMKFHLFPGADALSAIAKRVLPSPLLKVLLRQMQ